MVELQEAVERFNTSQEEMAANEEGKMSRNLIHQDNSAAKKSISTSITSNPTGKDRKMILKRRNEAMLCNRSDVSNDNHSRSNDNYSLRNHYEELSYGRRRKRLTTKNGNNPSAEIWQYWLLLATILCGLIGPASPFQSTPPPCHHVLLSHNHKASSKLPSSIGMTSSENIDEGGIGVGIDLGTTYSAIAILDPTTGLPTIIPIPENGRTMPSVVSLLNERGEAAVVGKEAINLESTQGSSYRNVKRIIGRGATAAQDSLDVVPFLLATAKEDKKKKNSRKRKKPETLSKQKQDAQENPALLLMSSSSPDDDTASFIRPEEISAHILRKLLQTVEEYTDQPVTRAVIGVPAYFHDAQREATIKAANLAGLDKVKLLREPEAAALAYGVGKQQLTSTGERVAPDSSIDDDEELVLVFDLGGGTYDVSMLLVGAGLTEIITTSGDGQLGGSDFDAKVAQHLRKVLAFHGLVLSTNRKTPGGESGASSAIDAIVRSSEMVRIYLSNNRKVKMALPLREEDWSHMTHASDIILPLDFEMEDGTPLSAEGISNSTHVLCELTRREMEKLCQDELLALLRPIREVAIMAGALLPGDTSPTIVEAAMQMKEEEDSMMFEDFYQESSKKPSSIANNEDDDDDDDDALDETMLLQLQEGLDEISMKEKKKAQQRGRKKARDVTKRERKYREEKRKLVDQTPAAEANDVKIRDGISGRPISRVVLVGGATRMPAVGRLIAALTGVVPQKTVNPDEAVALGCAVHVGILDGNEDLGTVLNPMQAAILRAVAEQQQKLGLLPADEFDDGDEEFDTVEYF